MIPQQYSDNGKNFLKKEEEQMMNFRDDEGKLELGELSETWMVDADDTPIAGVVFTSGEKIAFYGTEDNGNILYVFSFVSEEILQDVRNGRIELLSAFTDFDAQLWQEIDQNGTILLEETDRKTIDKTRLPEHGVFVLA